MQSDNGSEFVNQIMKEMKNHCQMEHRTITPYNPRANGTSERHIRTIKDTLFKQLKGAETQWVSYVQAVQYANNIRISTLHSSSPFSLFFGRKFNFFNDYADVISSPENLQELQKRMDFLTQLVYQTVALQVGDVQRTKAIRFDQSHPILTYPEGSEVMTKVEVRKGKAGAKYEGPYRIVRRTRGGAYELSDCNGMILPRRYTPDQVKPISSADHQYDTAIPKSQDGDSPAYEVERILNHKTQGRKKWYLVKWKNYPESENSWNCEDDFIDIEIIRNYWKNRKDKRP